MNDNDDIFARWLAAHRQSLPLQSLDREGPARALSRPVQCLGRLRLFWPVVGALIWISCGLLRVISRLYFDGLLPPRATRRCLRLASAFGEAALALMRKKAPQGRPGCSKPLLDHPCPNARKGGHGRTDGLAVLDG